MATTAFYVALTLIFFLLTLPICYLVLLFFTRYNRKNIPLACSIAHFVALYTCVIAFPLLVVDVNAAFRASTEQTWMRPLWLTIFILSYLSAWVSLPIAQMYTEVGDFGWKRALWHSIKLNLKLYAIIIGFILIIVVYLVIAKGAYTSFSSVGKVVISLANSWGLLMLILFMPAGLIGVPRKIWRNGDPTRELCRIFFDAVDLQEELDLATLDLAKMKGELVAIDPLVQDDHRPYLAIMLETIAEAEERIPMYRLACQRLKGVKAPDPHQEDLALPHLEELNATLKKKIKLATRIHFRWQAALRRSERLDRLARGVVVETDPWWKRGWQHYRRLAHIIGCALTGTLTVIILWGEVTLPFRLLTTFPLGLVEVLMKYPYLQFFTCVIFLFYMAYCAFWAAFQFKVFNVYVIYPGIADNASLCFNEVFLVRLLMPLCFNFLLLAGLATSEEDVQYGHVYRRNMDISLLFGTVVNQFLPVVIPVVAAVVFFKLTGKALMLVGIEVYNPDEALKPSVQRRLEHGKRLIEEDLGHPLGEVRIHDGKQEVVILSIDAAQVGGVESSGGGYSAHERWAGRGAGGGGDASSSCIGHRSFDAAVGGGAAPTSVSSSLPPFFSSGAAATSTASIAPRESASGCGDEREAAASAADQSPASSSSSPFRDTARGARYREYLKRKQQEERTQNF